MRADETQITKIGPEHGFLRLDLKDIWNYRELLYFLTLRDIKVRYKQTAIGVFWAVLQPVLTTLIFAVVFSQIARFDTAGPPYPLYVMSGLLVWLFVFNAVTFASGSLIGNTNLVTKVYFPRMIVPIAATLAGLVDLVPGLFVLLALMAFYGVAVSPAILLIPVFLGLTVILALGVGTLFAALNVRFRDVKFALPFALQIWMFISPIFYPLDILPPKAQTLIAFNPLTGILQGFRAALFGGMIDWRLTALSCVGTFAVLLVSLLIFKRMEDDFADSI
ncbi:MAG: ABC transporter permease [Acidobacteria bacterium]|nr:ABC transporter permease [Acidobacteriota bacterium]